MRRVLLRLPRVRRRRALAGGVAVLAVALGLGSPAVAATATLAPAAEGTAASAAGPTVSAARTELHAAQGTLAARLRQLDAAAAAFEQAQAHHLRLSQERTAAQQVVAGADAALTAARQELADRAAAAYRRPETGLVLGEAVLVAPDPGTALHRVALVGSLSTQDPRLETMKAARDRAATRLRHQQILDAGLAASTAEWQRRADALTGAVDDAQAQLHQAEAGMAAAESDAQAAVRAAAIALPAASAVGGMACPVGTPNGFIDSWGFPRSGGRSHQGVDIFAAHGTPLFAVADGTVQRISTSTLGGLGVHLLDDAGNRYYYAHLAASAVQAGQRVAAGHMVGTVGNTGNARTTPPHLHWQVHPGDGPPVNPYPLARALCRG